MGIKPKPITPLTGPSPRKRSVGGRTQAQGGGLVKGGKVTDRAISRNEQVGGVTGMLPGKPSDLKKMPSFLRKTKPVMPRKGGK